MSNYKDRNLILISSLKDKNILWCLNSDMFPFSSTLMESYTTINLDGPVLAFAEVVVYYLSLAATIFVN